MESFRNPMINPENKTNNSILVDAIAIAFDAVALNVRPISAIEVGKTIAKNNPEVATKYKPFSLNNNPMVYEIIVSEIE